MKLCEAAKNGHRCADDLCRGADVTLCGFDEELWDDLMVDEVDPRNEEEAVFDRAVERSPKPISEQEECL